MILEKSWVGDYQSIRYLAENSTPTLAENWLKRLKPSTNLPSTINEYESSKARQKRKTLEFQKLISLGFI